MHIQAETSLQQALEVVEAAPESAAGLTLYALVNTLEYLRAGGLFKLTKLQDLDPEHRAIAYGLMELLASDRIGDADWQAAKERMDRAVRGV